MPFDGKTRGDCPPPPTNQPFTIRKLSATTVWALLLAAVWLAIVGSYLRPRYSFDWDASQLGRGVTEYSIAKHQPHPPGYPLWVAAARVISKFTPNIPSALAIMALLFTAGALAVFALASREIFPGGGSGWIVALMAFSPPVLFYAAAQASYSSDLFAASAAAYFAVKIEKQSPRYFIYFCLLLAIAFGLRQSGAVFLLPLLAFSGIATWRRSKAEAMWGLLLGAAVFLAWFMPFVRQAGGWAAYRQATSKLFETTGSRTSIFLGSPAANHLSMLGDISIWLAATFAGLLLASAILRLAAPEREAERTPFRLCLLLLILGAPNLMFVALFHFPKPGYLMLSLPALFLGAGLAAGFDRRSAKAGPAAIAGIAASLAISFIPYQEWWGRQGEAGLPFQVSRYLLPALGRIEADNKLLADALSGVDGATQVVCLHWSHESPNCRSGPWDFPEHRWVDDRSPAGALPRGAKALFLCGRSGPGDRRRSEMGEWTEVARGWHMSIWLLVK